MFPQPVRAIYFDKSAATNWLVPWHQDLTISVLSRHEIPGYGPWSVKEGLVHVQPPADCLARMLTVRIHLDAADETNGALKVIPGSHSHGKLSPAQVAKLREQLPAHLCCANKGDALLLRPLLLHASGRSTTTSITHRRILHLEYAGFELPTGLAWNASA